MIQSTPLTLGIHGFPSVNMHRSFPLLKNLEEKKRVLKENKQ